ncbi:MAG: GntR family transcriptional regulator [Proteobacteria bacterium]|nr:GntR family transcriptional regulator [Pseudomonadota bacterium]
MNPISIYEDLREKIIWLSLKPGTTLNLVDLAAKYGVSRNPVTIALTRLEVEEWVVRSGSHFVVSPLTLDRMREITEIRLIMETQALIWTMHRITPEGIDKLEALKARIRSIDGPIPKREIIELDVEFHRLVFAESQNGQLATILDRLLNHYLRFWLSSPSVIDPKAFFKDILDVIEAIRAKDEIRLKAAATSHIKNSLDEIMGMN